MGYLNYGLNCREKNEELISRNSLPHYKRASSFTNKREAAWLHFLPNLSRYRRMIESVQHAGSARHSTTGDVYCMRAVPVTPRWRVNGILNCAFSFLRHVRLHSKLLEILMPTENVLSKKHETIIHLRRRCLLLALIKCTDEYAWKFFLIIYNELQ